MGEVQESNEVAGQDASPATNDRTGLWYKIKDYFFRYKECIHICASLFTIGSLILAVCIFYSDLARQNEIELNEHISNIRSLRLELSIDVAALESLVKNVSVLDQPFHGGLVLENLKRSVSDGKMQNEELKNSTIVAYFYGISFDESIAFINSPEFITASATSEDYHTRRSALLNTTIKDVEDRILPSFSQTLKYVGYYEECLRAKRDIGKCQNINFFGMEFEEYSENLINQLRSLGLNVSANIGGVPY